jgi:DsbC/DsbD-like thiol-disulfide interchange protein
MLFSVVLVTFACPRPVGYEAVWANASSGGTLNTSLKSQPKAEISAGEVKALIVLPKTHLISGHQVDIQVDVQVAPGWHIYGRPLPEGYTPTTVTFDNDLLSEQHLEFPKPTPLRFALLGETLPVYQGRFKAFGKIRLRSDLVPGRHNLNGTLRFQECNDSLCKMPQEERFTIPVWIDSLQPHQAS